MMTLYGLSGLSISTENIRFSLPVYMPFINIPVYRLDFKSVANVSGYLQNAGPGLEPNLGTKVDSDNHERTIANRY